MPAGRTPAAMLNTLRESIGFPDPTLCHFVDNALRCLDEDDADTARKWLQGLRPIVQVAERMLATDKIIQPYINWLVAKREALELAALLAQKADDLPTASLSLVQIESLEALMSDLADLLVKEQ